MPRSPRYLAPLLCVSALGALIVAVSPASALTRSQANKIALKALKPAKESGRVVLFGLRKPLKAGKTVFEAGSTKLKEKQFTESAKQLPNATWLFWEDLDYDGRFQHPSRLLLIDDESGRVTRKRKLKWYPLVDGKMPAFVGSGYHNSKYQVFVSKQVASSARTSSFRSFSDTRPLAQIAADAPLALPENAFKDDCIVMIGLRRDKQFAQDFTGMTAAAKRYGVRAFVVNSGQENVDADGQDLRTAVKKLTKDPQNCKDIMIYIDGHGYQTGPTGVNVGFRYEQVGQTRRGRKKYKVTPANVTSDDIADILKDSPDTTFKLKIDACYSGRFVLDLPKADHTNMLVLDVSSKADEVSYSYIDSNNGTQNTTNNPGNSNAEGFGRGEFTNGNLAGFEKFATSATEVANALAAGGSLFAQMIARGTELGKTDDFAQSQGLTHPLLADTLPDIPPGAPGSAEDFTMGMVEWWEHFGATSGMCTSITTTPPQAGASASVTASGSSSDSIVGSSTQTTTLNSSGTGQVRFTIQAYGTYTLNGTVTSSSGKTSTSSGTLVVSSAAGSQSCAA